MHYHVLFLVYEICDNDSNPCLNEATCSVHLFNYLCTCMENYTGEYCETSQSDNNSILIIIKMIIACNMKSHWGIL